MKRLLILVLLLCMMASSALAGDALLDEAVSMGAFIRSLAGDTAYVKLISASPALTERCSEFAAGDTQPVRVTVYTFDQQQLLDLFADHSGEDLAAIAPEHRPLLFRRIAASIDSVCFPPQRAEDVAVREVLRYSRVLAADADFSARLYIFDYAEGAPVAVTGLSDDGIVTLSATFLVGLPNEELLPLLGTPEMIDLQ